MDWAGTPWLGRQLADLGLPLQWEWFTTSGLVLMPDSEDEDGPGSDPGPLNTWGDPADGPVQVAWQVVYRGKDPRYRRGAWAAVWHGRTCHGECSRGVSLRHHREDVAWPEARRRLDVLLA